MTDVLEATTNDRPLVPSTREEAGGKPRPDYRPGSASAIEDERTTREVVSDYFQRLNPLTMTGGQTPVPLLLLLLAGAFGAIDNATGILIPEMRRDLGIQTVTFVAIYSLLNGFTPFLGPIAGYLGDRLPRVKLLVIGNAGFAIGTILMSQMTSALGFFGIQLGRSIVSAPNFPVSGPLLADYYPPETRGRIFSAQSVFGTTASLIGLGLVGILGDTYGWRATLIILGIPSLLIGSALIFIKEPRRGQMDGAGMRTGAPEPPAPGLAETLRICFGVKTLRRIWYAQPMITFGAGGVFLLLQFFLADQLHYSASSRAALVALSTAGSIIGLVLFAPYIDALLAHRPGQILALSGTLFFINMMLFMSMSVVAIVPWILFVLFIIPFMSSPLAPATTALETTVIPARVRSLGMQIKGIAGLPGGFAIPILFKVAQDGGVPLALAIASPFFLLGAVLLISASSQVEPDLRAARAANAAAEEAARHREGKSKKILICRDVDVEYDGVRILFHVDFDVEQGELVALLGTNGAGKSTLLRSITGLTEASNGAIFLDGDDITHTPPYEIARRGVVLMPGGRGVFPGMTVGENLALADWLGEAEGAGARRDRVLNEFFPVLNQKLAQKAGSLSGGEQQMLSLAQAFIMDAKLLLIDELSLGLAPAVVDQLLAVLQEIRASGTTVLMVEQSVELALRIADRAVFMEKGEVRFSGAAAELRTRQDLLRSVFLRGGSAAGGGAIARSRSTVSKGRPEAILAVRGVSTSYGGVMALRGVDLQVGRDEIVGIIGPNGAGKTTLFDAISGYVQLDAGQVIFAGRDVSLLSPDSRARMGMTRAFQDSSLFPTLTVRETLMAALEKQVRARYAIMTATWLPAVRNGEALLSRRVDRLVEMFNLGEFADRFAVELSTGTRRVLGMAVVVATEPDMVLLDEPSSGLAQTETAEMGPLLRRVQAEAGCGLLVIEHDMKLIRDISDHLVAMDQGALLVEGTPDQVLSDERVVAAYLGNASRQNEPVAAGRTQKEM